MHVLICDDDASTRLVLRRWLEGTFHCAVHESNSGPDALRQLAAQKFAFAVLDLEMPGMSGVETLTTIRQTPDTHDLPVVILSRERSEKAVIELKGLGISDYILKPTRREQVLEKFGRLINALPPQVE